MRSRDQKSRIFWSAISVVILLFTTQGHAAVDPETAVGVWLFNEDGGDLAKDLTENALDAKFLDPVKWAEGKFDSGLEFKSGGLANAGISPLLNVGKKRISLWSHGSNIQRPLPTGTQASSQRLTSLCRDTATSCVSAGTLTRTTKENRYSGSDWRKVRVSISSVHHPSMMESGTISPQLLTEKAQ